MLFHVMSSYGRLGHVKPR